MVTKFNLEKTGIVRSELCVGVGKWVGSGYLHYHPIVEAESFRGSNKPFVLDKRHITPIVFISRELMRKLWNKRVRKLVILGDRPHLLTWT